MIKRLLNWRKTKIARKKAVMDAQMESIARMNQVADGISKRAALIKLEIHEKDLPVVL